MAESNLERYLTNPYDPLTLDVPSSSRPRQSRNPREQTISSPESYRKLSASSSSTSNPSILSRQDSRSSATSLALSEESEAEELNTNFADMTIRGAELPCLFRDLVDCSVVFDINDTRPWYSHNLSHFPGRNAPTLSMCIFCDDTFNAEEGRSWTRRMEHIAIHIREGWHLENSRPDFHTIKHLYKIDGMSKHDYKHARGGTERPLLNGLPLQGLRHIGYVPKEIQAKINKENDDTNRIIINESHRERREIRNRRDAKTNGRNRARV